MEEVVKRALLKTLYEQALFYWVCDTFSFSVQVSDFSYFIDRPNLYLVKTSQDLFRTSDEVREMIQCLGIKEHSAWADFLGKSEKSDIFREWWEDYEKAQRWTRPDIAKALLQEKIAAKLLLSPADLLYVSCSGHTQLLSTATQHYSKFWECIFGHRILCGFEVPADGCLLQ